MKASFSMLLIVATLSICVFTQFPVTYQQTQNSNTSPTPCHPGLASCSGVKSPKQGGGITCKLADDSADFLVPPLLAFAEATLIANNVTNYVLIYLCLQVVGGINFIMVYTTNQGIIATTIFQCAGCNYYRPQNYVVYQRNYTLPQDVDAANVFFGVSS